MFLNLAPHRYRKVCCDEGGPVKRIQTYEDGENGTRSHRAYVWLETAIGYQNRATYEAFGNADGYGWARDRNEAVYRAISEAMERWAHFALRKGPTRHQFAFDVDPSSNGMAAFPGLWERQARRPALREARERWLLRSWWTGALPHFVEGTRGRDEAIFVKDPEMRFWLAVVHTADPGRDLHYFGFGADPNPREAERRARAEQKGMREAVIRFWEAHRDDPEAYWQCTEAFERRPVYYASPEGYADFAYRLTRQPHRPYRTPTVLYDGPLVGPWSKYASVWRVAYHHDAEIVDPNSLTFFW